MTTNPLYETGSQVYDTIVDPSQPANNEQSSTPHSRFIYRGFINYNTVSTGIGMQNLQLTLRILE